MKIIHLIFQEEKVLELNFQMALKLNMTKKGGGDTKFETMEYVVEIIETKREVINNIFLR